MIGWQPVPGFRPVVDGTPSGPLILREIWHIRPMFPGDWAWVITEYYHATMRLNAGVWKVDREPTIMSSAFDTPGARFAFPPELADTLEAHIAEHGMPTAPGGDS